MQNRKEQIRKEILDKLRSQPEEKAGFKSEKIKNKLFSLEEFRDSKIVMFYASLPEEVNTNKMIDEALEMGKRVVLPRCESFQRIVPKEIRNRNTDIEKSSHGIRQPKKDAKEVSLKEIDLIIVPGVAFDKKMGRLGRGKGYYDRFLKEAPSGKKTVGLAFDFQILENLPKGSLDIPVSKVITNE